MEVRRLRKGNIAMSSYGAALLLRQSRSGFIAKYHPARTRMSDTSDPTAAQPPVFVHCEFPDPRSRWLYNI